MIRDDARILPVVGFAQAGVFLSGGDRRPYSRVEFELDADELVARAEVFVRGLDARAQRSVAEDRRPVTRRRSADAIRLKGHGPDRRPANARSHSSPSVYGRSRFALVCPGTGSGTGRTLCAEVTKAEAAAIPRLPMKTNIFKGER